MARACVPGATLTEGTHVCDDGLQVLRGRSKRQREHDGDGHVQPKLEHLAGGGVSASSEAPTRPLPVQRTSSGGFPMTQTLRGAQRDMRVCRGAKRCFSTLNGATACALDSPRGRREAGGVLRAVENGTSRSCQWRRPGAALRKGPPQKGEPSGSAVGRQRRGACMCQLRK